MAYDIFSQPKGPDISISLFSDAAKAGAAVGKEIPGTTQAIIEGVTQGVQTGQKIYDNYQRAEIQQHAIERFPQADRAQDAAITEAEQLNKIRQNTVEASALTKETQLKIAQQESENKLQAAQQAATDFDLKKQLSLDLSSTDQATRKNVLFDPKYSNILLNDPKLTEAIAGKLAGNGDLSPEEKQKVFEQVDFAKNREYEHQIALEKERYADQQKRAWDKTKQDIIEDGQLQQVMRDNNLTIADLGKLKSEVSMPSSPGGSPYYNLSIDGKKIKNVLDEGSNKNLLAAQTYFDNLSPKTRATTSSSPTASPTPAPKGPYSAALFTDYTRTPNPLGPQPSATPTAPAEANVPQTGSPIVDQKTKDLVARASSDPVLKNRLLAKGIIKEAPVSPQTPRPQAEIKPTASHTPNPTPTQSLKKEIGFSYKELPPDIKKHVEQKVVFNVLNEPLLRGVPSFYKAVAAVESGGEKHASNDGAIGLFQLRGPAAEDAEIDNRSDPTQNVKGGMKYLDLLLRRFSGNKMAALMAYNIGQGVVAEAIKLTNSSDYTDIMFGLNYLKNKGRFPKLLTKDNIKTVAKYPFQVFAYEEAFDSVANA